MAGMEGMVAKLATKYGEAVDGKHKGTKINLGGDPNKQVEAGTPPTHAVFIDDKEVKGRYEIGKDIVALKWISADPDKVVVELAFADGETTTVELTPPKPESGFMKIFKMFSGVKPVDLKDPVEKYRLIGAFLLTFAKGLTEYPANEAYDYLKANEYFKIAEGDDSNASAKDKHIVLVKLCVERFAVKVQAGNQR